MKIVLSGIYYPVAILRYFESALKNRDGVELITVGPYTGRHIPWRGGMDLPEKYAISPDLSFNQHIAATPGNFNSFFGDSEKLKDVDVWIQCDAGWHLIERPPARISVHIATDPHVLPYAHQRTTADFFFNMQKFYMEPGDIYLPYAASRYHHYPMDVEKTTDVAMIGLEYENRRALANKLIEQGYRVDFRIGLGFDEYTEANNKAKVIVSWSSKQDLIARVFEAGAMKVPLVTNDVPDLGLHFDENDLRIFNNDAIAIFHVTKALSYQEQSMERAENMYEKIIEKHTYDHRIQQIFDAIGI